jgi:Icc-related predicted phosphoesterase
MSLSYFVSDLHGSIDRYHKLFNHIQAEKPDAVFFGGDLLPSGLYAYSSAANVPDDFIEDILKAGFLKLKDELKEQYPEIFIILGNDDSKSYEHGIIEGEKKGLWKYVHGKRLQFKTFDVYGYSYIPPSPFMMKDWEKYDVSRYVDPGCVPPEEGSHSFQIKKDDILYSTIKKDLDQLTEGKDLSQSIFLFHSPPYKTKLDRAALDGMMYDHAPLDVHIGSIAIQRFIQEKQPLLTLHGHVHESAGITGTWKDTIGTTQMYSAAHDGEELALVRFDPQHPQEAERLLI